MASFVAVLVGCSLVACNPAAAKKQETASAASASASTNTTHFPYVDSPGAGEATEGPLECTLGDREVRIASVSLQPYNAYWNVTLSAAPQSGADMDLHSTTTWVLWHLDVNRDLAAGLTLTKATKEMKGYVSFNIGAADPTGTHVPTDVLGDAYSAIITITKWDATPYNPKIDGPQIVGHASGRLYLAMKPPGAPVVSGCKGAFADAPIRYNGKHPWPYE